VRDDALYLTLGAMPAIVRARLSAGLTAREDIQLDDGRTQRATRSYSAHAVFVTEWPHSDDALDGRAATIYLLDPGVFPPASHLARGSTAWLPLDADAEDVVAAAGALVRGLTVVSPAVLPNAGAPRTRPVRAEPRAMSRASTDDEPHLTDRELEVLRALAEGLGNKHIGARLGISASTVKYHLQAIFSKLGVRTRSEAVSYGLRRGVVPL
jgi:two-component system, NarL family, nitrate/nitrite response regulator NarL